VLNCCNPDCSAPISPTSAVAKLRPAGQLRPAIVCYLARESILHYSAYHHVPVCKIPTTLEFKEKFRISGAEKIRFSPMALGKKKFGHHWPTRLLNSTEHVVIVPPTCTCTPGLRASDTATKVSRSRFAPCPTGPRRRP